MVVETREQQYKRYKKELDHIIKEVLDEENDSDIKKPLQEYRYENISDMVSLKDSGIIALDFTDDSGDVIEQKFVTYQECAVFKNFTACVSKQDVLSTILKTGKILPKFYSIIFLIVQAIAPPTKHLSENIKIILRKFILIFLK